MNLKTRYNIVICAILLAGIAAGRGEPTPAATNAPPDAISPQTLRDPFWPVGFRPVPVSKKQVSEQASRIRELTRWPTLALRGITRTGKGEYIAIIDGIGLAEPGDIISMRRGGLIYRWRINDITADGISRTRLDVREPMSAPQQTE